MQEPASTASSGLLVVPQDVEDVGTGSAQTQSNQHAWERLWMFGAVACWAVGYWAIALSTSPLHFRDAVGALEHVPTVLIACVLSGMIAGIVLWVRVATKDRPAQIHTQRDEELDRPCTQWLGTSVLHVLQRVWHPIQKFRFQPIGIFLFERYLIVVDDGSDWVVLLHIWRHHKYYWWVRHLSLFTLLNTPVLLWVATAPTFLKRIHKIAPLRIAAPAIWLIFGLPATVMLNVVCLTLWPWWDHKIEWLNNILQLGRVIEALAEAPAQLMLQLFLFYTYGMEENAGDHAKIPYGLLSYALQTLGTAGSTLLDIKYIADGQGTSLLECLEDLFLAGVGRRAPLIHSLNWRQHVTYKDEGQLTAEHCDQIAAAIRSGDQFLVRTGVLQTVNFVEDNCLTLSAFCVLVSAAGRRLQVESTEITCRGDFLVLWVALHLSLPHLMGVLKDLQHLRYLQIGTEADPNELTNKQREHVGILFGSLPVLRALTIVGHVKVTVVRDHLSVSSIELGSFVHTCLALKATFHQVSQILIVGDVTWQPTCTFDNQACCSWKWQSCIIHGEARDVASLEELQTARSRKTALTEEEHDEVTAFIRALPDTHGLTIPGHLHIERLSLQVSSADLGTFVRVCFALHVALEQHGIIRIAAGHAQEMRCNLGNESTCFCKESDLVVCGNVTQNLLAVKEILAALQHLSSLSVRSNPEHVQTAAGMITKEQRHHVSTLVRSLPHLQRLQVSDQLHINKGGLLVDNIALGLFVHACLALKAAFRQGGQVHIAADTVQTMTYKFDNQTACSWRANTLFVYGNMIESLTPVLEVLGELEHTDCNGTRRILETGRAESTALLKKRCHEFASFLRSSHNLQWLVVPGQIQIEQIGPQIATYDLGSFLQVCLSLKSAFGQSGRIHVVGGVSGTVTCRFENETLWSLRTGQVQALTVPIPTVECLRAIQRELPLRGLQFLELGKEGSYQLRQEQWEQVMDLILQPFETIMFIGSAEVESFIHDCSIVEGIFREAHAVHLDLCFGQCRIGSACSYDWHAKQLIIGRMASVGPHGCQQLKKLYNLRQLIIMSHNELGAEGCQHLKELAELIELRIGGHNNIGSEGCAHLANMSKLRRLIVGAQNGVEAPDLQALRSRGVSVEVISDGF